MSWEAWNAHKKAATVETRLRRSLRSPVPDFGFERSVRTGMPAAGSGATRLGVTLRKEVTKAANFRKPSMPVMPWGKS